MCAALLSLVPEDEALADTAETVRFSMKPEACKEDAIVVGLCIGSSRAAVPVAGCLSLPLTDKKSAGGPASAACTAAASAAVATGARTHTIRVEPPPPGASTAAETGSAVRSPLSETPVLS